MDNTAIIVSVSLVLVLVVTGMIAFLVAGGKSGRRKRVISVIRGGGAMAESGGRRMQNQNTRRETLARKLKESAAAEKTADKKKSLPLMIEQAGLSISVKQFWIFAVSFTVAAIGAAFVTGQSPFVILMVGIISFVGVPRFALKKLAARRQKAFLKDLADVFESMVRLLKAGMPVSEAVKMIAREFEGPVAEEMGRIFDQQKIGISLPDAVADCARRMPLTEVQMFATAIAIQAQTGSSLSEVFDNLARVVRSRFKLKRKVQALSSEAKASAMIIGALPVFVATGLYFINPEYIGVLFVDPLGKMLVGGAITWMMMGVLIMKQMINFKI